MWEISDMRRVWQCYVKWASSYSQLWRILQGPSRVKTHFFFTPFAPPLPFVQDLGFTQQISHMSPINLSIQPFKQTRCSRGCSTISFIIHSLNPWPFSSRSSEHLHSQTVRARELKIWDEVHLPPPDICLMSHVMRHVSCFMCQVSGVTSHMSRVIGFIFFHFFSLKLVEGLLSMRLLCLVFILTHLFRHFPTYLYQ